MAAIGGADTRTTDPAFTPPICLGLTSRLGSLLDHYIPNLPPSQQPSPDIPASFLHAMHIREAVYVHEQHIPLENELDEDDRKSYYSVAYAADQPVGCIRLVPPPDDPVHVFDKHRQINGETYVGEVKSDVHDGSEIFVKLGRLAVLKEWRGKDVSRLLVERAVEWAATHDAALSDEGEFKGLVLVHAQIGLQKFWSRHGFVLDEGMGIWDEEGIDHVAMWRRLEVKECES
ncbi:hypothetical protein B0A48_10060 [Cryoendolithus antarcticus]|uniref:N-acetyltransferase domain-containing protein n=1 Tax=Cryoendolithus antarcticus TaxID=1507870 RepID=A0A1V8T3T6_9PEZI|nr:hypothetical protein B0A48_10060 [Cryoendolithus antarcticus]